MAGRHQACKKCSLLTRATLTQLARGTHTHTGKEREAGTQTHRHARKVKLAHLSYFTFLTHFKRGEPKRHKVTAGTGQESGGRGGATPAAPAVDDCILFSCVILCILYTCTCIYYIEYIIRFYVFSLFSVFSALFSGLFLIYFYFYFFLLGPCRALKQIHAQSPS